ncbi:MAG: flagellar hook capping protein [Bacteroidetes bacterium]|nr:flagellar hook capping protein [Bacteroidota bacterium]
MVDGVTNVANSQSSTVTQTSNSTLGKNDFMNLLIAQMKNQDPMSPMDGTQFAAQLAQFSSLEQLQNLNDEMTTSINANYALTQSINNTLSATLIGKEVKVNGGDFQNNGQQSVQLGYTLPGQASSVTLNIYDANGNLVKSFDNLSTSTGDNKLSWDFTDNNGSKVQNGKYTFSVTAKGTDGSDMQADLFKLGTVDGVKFSNSGTSLTVDGSDYQLSDIAEIINPNLNGGN